jgi:hypothetical protein
MYKAASLVADARVVQGQLELVLASAGVAELEEVDRVILLLPCILLSLLRCTLALCCVYSRCPLSRCSLYLCSLIIGVVLCLAAGDLCFPYRLWAASRR